MAKPKRQKPPRISDAEKEQVRIRTKLEHGFAITTDQFGRARLASGAPSLDETPDGTIRLRTFDPLASMPDLSNRRWNAGRKYREAYEVMAKVGVKPASLAVKVDGGGNYKDIPTPILDAFRVVRESHLCIGHHQIEDVVEKVCGLRMSFREIANAEPRMTPRPALPILLDIGLDKIADHFFGPMKKSA